MKRSIIATTILLLISISLVALTFGIGERMTIVSYNDNTPDYLFDETEKNHRIDMYNPDSLSLVTSKPIYDYDLSVDLEDIYTEEEISADSDIEYLNQNMLLSDEEMSSEMPNPNILPAMAYNANNIDRTADKLSVAVDLAIQNARSREAPRVAIDLSKISVFRYEPVVINASVYTEDVVKNISIYVRYKKDKIVRMNGDERHSINVFKVKNSEYKGTYLHPFGGDLGEYQAVVLVQTKNGVYGYTKDFTVKGRQSPPAKETKKIATLEYAIDLTTKTKELYQKIKFDKAIYFHAWAKNNKSTVDTTHLNIYGADMVAYLFAKELAKTNNHLANYLKNDITEPNINDSLIANPDYIELPYKPFDKNLYNPTNNFKLNDDFWFATAFGDNGSNPLLESTGYFVKSNDNTYLVGQDGAYLKGRIGETEGIVFLFHQVPKEDNFIVSCNATVITKKAGEIYHLLFDCYVFNISL